MRRFVAPAKTCRSRTSRTQEGMPKAAGVAVGAGVLVITGGALLSSGAET